MRLSPFFPFHPNQHFCPLDPSQDMATGAVRHEINGLQGLAGMERIERKKEKERKEG